jgi:hypothetical protein
MGGTIAIVGDKCCSATEKTKRREVTRGMHDAKATRTTENVAALHVPHDQVRKALAGWLGVI